MKKRILAAVVMGTMIALAACGGSSDSSSTTAAAAAETEAAAEDTAEEAAEPAAEKESMTLRFATDSTEDYVSTVEIYKFADEVEEKTDGRIKVEVYAGGQLGDEKSCVEQVQMGSLDLTKSSMGALTSFNDDLTILSMPYMFKSEDHLWKVMDSDIGQSLLDSMEGTGLVGIGWLDAGSRNFYAVVPLEGPESFKGLKIRVMESPIYTDMADCLGASPIAMSGNDIYSALQTGVVDGAENNIPRIIDMSHDEICKYLIMDRHNIMPEMVMISQATWDSLDAEDQAIIMEAAKNLQDRMIAAWADTENDALETLREEGMEIVEPTAEVVAAFREAMQPVYDNEGAPFADLIERIESMAD